MIDSTKVLQKEKVRYKTIPADCLELRSFCNEVLNREKESRIASACLEIENGSDIFIGLMCRINKITQEEAQETFSKIENAPECRNLQNANGLVDELKRMRLYNMKTARGFTSKKNKSGYEFNANVYANHIQKRVTMVSLNSGELAVYSSDGVFQIVSTVELGKLIRSDIHEAIPNAWKSFHEAEVVKALERDAPIIDELDTNKEFINLKNGMLNLTTFKLEQHDQKFRSSIQIPIKFDYIASCPSFMKYLNEVTQGDESLQMVLQQLTGYLMSYETKAEKAFFLHGTGSNGKSVYAKVVEFLVGKDNISNVPLEKIGEPFGLQPIIGKTVNIAAENEVSSGKLNSENLKAIISGDRMNINIKYKNALNYTPIIKLVFLSNTLPPTADLTFGFFRKIMIIPFNKRFNEEEQDVNLIEKLLTELPGILNWALEGLKTLRSNHFKFSESTSVTNALIEYEESQNPVLKFISEAIVEDSTSKLSNKEIIANYYQWTHKNSVDDNTAHSAQKFWAQFKSAIQKNNLMAISKKINGNMYFGGINFSEEFKRNCKNIHGSNLDL